MKSKAEGIEKKNNKNYPAKLPAEGIEKENIRKHPKKASKEGIKKKIGIIYPTKPQMEGIKRKISRIYPKTKKLKRKPCIRQLFMIKYQRCDCGENCNGNREQINTHVFAAGASSSEVCRVRKYKIKICGSLTKWR